MLAMIGQLIRFALLLHSVFSAYGREFDISCNSNLVMYWGQNSHGQTSPGENQLPLDEYCDKDDGDVLVLSFLSEFNADGLHSPTLNLASACVTTFNNSTLLHCPNIGKAIAKCQKKGKIVILSLGGASGGYGFSDDVQAERYADKIWDLFLGGNSQQRPFDEAVLDGIDLDIEGGSSVGYVRFVQRLRERFIESPGRRFYTTAAPQCPYPDFYSGPILDNAYLDMVFVQFYNNYCGVDKPSWFNFEQWHEWATTVSANKDVRVYLGVPGSPSAASTGYTQIGDLEDLVNATRKRFNSFGGMMVWDASQADTNRVSDDASFADIAKKMLEAGRKCSDGSDALEPTTETELVSQTVVVTVTSSSTATSSSKGESNATSPLRESMDPSDSAGPRDSSSSSSSSTSRFKSSSGSNASDGSKTLDTSQHDGSTLPRVSKPEGAKEAKMYGKEPMLRHIKPSIFMQMPDTTKVSTTTIVDDNGTATVMTHFEVSEVNGNELDADSAPAVESTEESLGDDQVDEDASSSTPPSSDDDGSSTGDATADDTAAGDSPNDGADSAESTPIDSAGSTQAADSASDNAERIASEESPVTDADSGAESTTVQTTKVLHTTMTKTRKIHLVTKRVTKRVKKFTNQGVNTLTETSTTTTNRTTSIVTPTFPLPIARCPRADQPCMGAGFACNGYEFGQCVNNRWLMRPCSTDRVTACFNAGPDLIACDFTKGRALQVCDDILSPLPYGRLASNVLFLRSDDQERALNTPVYPVPSSTTTTAPTHVKKKKDDDDNDDDDTDDDDDDYNYNKYGEKKKNTSTSTTTDMELVKQSSGVNLIDDHNRREDPAMLMAKDPEAYYGPDGHIRAVGGNVVDDLREHNSYGTKNEPYDEYPPVDDPEEGDEYSEGDEFMRKRDAGAWDEEQAAASSVPATSSSTESAIGFEACAEHLAKRDIKDLIGASVSMAHMNEKGWRSQLEDFYAIYALYTAFSGMTSDATRQQFERVILDHIDGDFLIPPRLTALEGRPMLARFVFVPLRGEDSDFLHHRTKDGMVEEDILVVVRMLTNVPIPKRWRVALPLSLNATMLHTSRGTFYAGDRVSPEVMSLYQQRVSFYNKNIRLNTNKKPAGPEPQHLEDLAAGHSINDTGRADSEFSDGPGDSGVKRNLIVPAIISHILHMKPDPPLPRELLYEPIPNDPAGRLYEVRSDPSHENERSMALYFTIRVKTRASGGKHVSSALPHSILSFITTY